MNATELAARQSIRPQSLTRILAELDAAGLIQRTRDGRDGRESILKATPKALALMREEGRRKDVLLRETMERVLSPVEIEFLRLAANTLNKLADGWSGDATQPSRVNLEASA